MLTVVLLVAITAIAGVLRLLHLGQVPGNPFYDAAVHTMARSWHAFLFGALDPSGGVSVDKPPVDLWMQVASVKLLGFNPTALKLPQAIKSIQQFCARFVGPRFRWLGPQSTQYLSNVALVLTALHVFVSSKWISSSVQL